MIIDNLLILSDAQTAVTVAATTSTYYIDMLAAGFSHNDELYAQFLVDTAFSVTAAASMTMAIVISSETTFASQSIVASRTLNVDSIKSAATTIAAGTVLATLKLGPNLFKQDPGAGTASYRYLFATLSSTVLMADGKFDCRLVKDIDMTMDRIL